MRIPRIAAMAAVIGKLGASIVALAGHFSTALPAAAALIPILAGLGSAFLVLNQAVSGNKGLDRWMDRVTASANRAGEAVGKKLVGVLNTALPQLQAHFQQVGAGLELMFQRIQDALDSGGLNFKLTAMLDAAAVSTTNLGSVFSNLVEILITLGAAASDVSQRFTMWLSQVTTNWRNWLNEAYRTGELTDILNRAGDAMAQWGRIAGNIIGGLIGLFRAAAGPGARLADSLERVTASFRAWANSAEGAAKVRQVLNFLTQIDVGQILRIAAAFTAMGLAMKGVLAAMGMVQGLAKLVSLFQMFPVMTAAMSIFTVGLGALAAALAYAYTTSEQFRTAVNDLVTFLAGTVGPAIQAFATAFGETFGVAIQQVATLMTTQLIPNLRLLVTNLNAALAPVGGLSGAMQILGQILGTVVGTAVMQLVQALNGLIVVFNAVMAAGTALSAGLNTAFAAAIAAGQRLRTALVAAFNAVVAAAQSAWQRVQAATSSAWASIVATVTSSAQRLLAALRAALNSIVAAAQSAWNTIRSAAVSAWNSIVSAVQSAINRVVGAIQRLIGAVRGAVGPISAAARSIGSGIGAGVSAALGPIRSVIGALSSLISMARRAAAAVRSAAAAGGGAGGRGFASGGIVSHTNRAAVGGPRRGQTLVGEHGPEMVSLPSGAKVHPASNTSHMLGPAGGGERRIVLEINAGAGRVDRMLVELLRDAVRVRGGDVQSVLGVR